MCGIAGVFDPLTPPDAALLERLAAPLVWRGPDDAGQFLAGPLGLAHRRLSIIDLAGGHQPMFNEDRSLAIVFNGELYDHGRWREQLAARGHRFQTTSDTEVLLHLYEDQGDAMFAQLNGMFALALCRLPAGDLVLARDRFGKKPLFYAHAGPRFAFASGPASLRPLPWVDCALDPLAVHDYLEFLYVPTPRCIHRGIAKLPPGSWLRFRDGQLEVRPYWRPRVTGAYRGTYADARAELTGALTRAVKRRLVADVPLGLFLSGGMDSGLICALAQRELGQPARTFTIGFPDPRYDERAYAATVAAHTGTEHHFREVNPGDFSRLEWLVPRCEEPFADSSLLPTALLAEFTRQHVTVALSGDGADELFGGYYRYRVFHLADRLARLPRAVRRGLRTLLLAVLPRMREERTFWGKVRRLADLGDADGLDRYLRLISRFPETRRRPLYGERLRAAAVRPSRAVLDSQLDGTDVNAIMELELRTYLPDDILVKVDRASMAHSLEVRCPFLDPEVVELALQLPYEFKQTGTTRKRLLADTFRDLLPPAIFTRPKLGFGVPVAAWLRHEWRTPVTDLLLGGRLVADGWFDRAALELFLREHLDEQADHSYALFALLVLELWLRSLTPA